jgi:5-formyltetrahydrofolate cyclo-ligase
MDNSRGQILSKAGARILLKEKREKLGKEETLKKSLELCRIFTDSPEFKNANSVCCYLSFNLEIDTFSIIEECFRTKKILSVPVVSGKEMFACKITSLGNLKKNKYGILEPVNIDKIDKNDVDIVIVPALGYTENKYRVGYGKGFYDKFLKDYKGLTAGLVFKDFIVDFRYEEFDIPVKKLFILS